MLAFSRNFSLSIMLCGFIGTSYAQNSSISVEDEQPLVVLNFTIIANGPAVPIEVGAIKEVVVYKAEQLPPTFRGLAPAGVIAVSYAGQVVSKSLADLSRELGAPKAVAFALNGHPLSPEQITTLRIVPQAIAHSRLIPAVARAQPATVNITLAKTQPRSDYPPGTVMLR